MQHARTRRQLDRLLLSAVRVLKPAKNPSDTLRQRMLRSHCLCAVVSGGGTLTVNGHVHTVQQGDLFALAPGTIVQGTAAPGEPVRCALILFHCAGLHKGKTGWQALSGVFPLSGRVEIPDDSPARDELALLIEGGDSVDVHIPASLRRKLALHRLLATLLDCGAAQHKTGPSASEVGFEAALAFMNDHYAQDIKVKQLASKAGLSVNHFIRIFKRQLQTTPIQYIERKRMDSAKQLLFSGDKMKEIAKRVGYKDEHYFSRAFKKAEGIAPTLFMKHKCSRIAAMYYGLDDFLLTLGLRPIASLSYAERVSRAYPAHTLHTPESRSMLLDSLKPNYDKLLRAKPDLILTSSRFNESEMLRQIAPTAVLEYTNDYASRLAHIGRLFGKEREAAHWIERYKTRQSGIRQRLARQSEPPSACFVRVCASFYRIYGIGNQTGSLLHGELGLALPEGLPRQRWTDFAYVEWPDFEPDHIFLMIDPTEAARQRAQLLLQSESWRALTAVRSGRVHDASDLLFATLGPTGRLSAMNRIAMQLGLDDGEMMQHN